jgi:hypothetical protein
VEAPAARITAPTPVISRTRTVPLDDFGTIRILLLLHGEFELGFSHVGTGRMIWNICSTL